MQTRQKIQPLLSCFDLKKTIYFLVSMSAFTALYYPGLMSADSNTMYQSAQAYLFSDHHPPALSFVWHYALKIIDGPHLIYGLQMGLLWSSVYLLSFRIIKHRGIALVTLFAPWLPQVLVYAGFIWKDIIFTFGYGLLSVILLFKNIHQKKFNLIESLAFLIALMFFTSVKFQAKFILPILLLWYFSTLSYPIIKSLLLTGLTTCIILSCITHFNQYLVNANKGSSYSWQYKKIYDLAGMILHTHQIEVPKFLWRNPQIAVSDIQSHFDLNWEPLIVYPHSPFRNTRNKAERTELHRTWLTAIKQHPFAYFKHRGYIFVRGLLISAPGKGWLLDKLQDRVPHTIHKAIGYLSSLASYIFLLPIQIYCLITANRCLAMPKLRPYAQAILYLGAMSFMLLGVLLFFSLASVARYIYFCYFNFMLTLPLAAYCFVYARQRETTAPPPPKQAV